MDEILSATVDSRNGIVLDPIANLLNNAVPLQR